MWSLAHQNEWDQEIEELRAGDVIILSRQVTPMTTPDREEVDSDQPQDPQEEEYPIDIQGLDLSLSPTQSIVMNRVYLVPDIRSAEEEIYQAKVQKEAAKLILPPSQEHLRNNLAAFIVYSKKYQKENTPIAKLKKVLGFHPK